MPERGDGDGDGDGKILQPQGELRAPPYGYVQGLLSEREQLYGASGSAATDAAAEDRSTSRSKGPLRGRSFDLLAREIRARRQLLRDPSIPRNYRKLTKALRPGSAMLADFAIRIPALLAAKPMTCAWEPSGEDDERKGAASRIEDFVHAVLFGRAGQRGLLDRGRTSVWRDVFDNAASLGQAGWLLTCRADRWSEASPAFPRRGAYVADGQEEGRPRERASQRYTRAVQRYKQGLLPFTLESVDPTTFYVREDEEGIEDEAVILTVRPFRETLQAYGLRPAEGVAGAGAHGPDVLQGRSGKYVAGPAGLGRPFAADEWPTTARVQQGVECIAYYCSARRAHYLGLVPADADPDAGVWAYYVDGVVVAADLLWGPAWHPLPLFTPLGLTTALQDPNYRGVSALFTLIDLADCLDEILTMERHVAYWSAWPPLIERDLSGSGGATGLPAQTLVDPEAVQRPDAAGAKDRRTIEPAGFYSLPPGKTWEWLVLPAEATSHIERLKADVQGYLDLLGVPAALRGGAPAGESGYHAALVQVAARVVYDPIVENVTLAAQQSVQYMVWQIWKRFPEGVAAQASSGAPPLGRRGPRRISRAAVTVHPRDIAPEWESPANPGVPVLDCTVIADPLLPIDEMQLEQRGINAVQAGMIDEDTAREKYFGDPAPERTAARIIADSALKLPIVVESLAIRAAVRQGVLLPELAPLYLAARVGIPAELAMQQLAQIGAAPAGAGASDAEAQQDAMAQAQAGIAAGGLAPGQEAVPGVPGVPGVPPVQLPPLAPPMGVLPAGPAGSTAGGASLYPGQGPGYPVNSGGAMPPTQPTTQQRLAAAVGGR